MAAFAISALVIFRASRLGWRGVLGGWVSSSSGAILAASFLLAAENLAR
jgi:hypothetical protein